MLLYMIILVCILCLILVTIRHALKSEATFFSQFLRQYDLVQVLWVLRCNLSLYSSCYVHLYKYGLPNENGCYCNRASKQLLVDCIRMMSSHILHECESAIDGCLIVRFCWITLLGYIVIFLVISLGLVTNHNHNLPNLIGYCVLFDTGLNAFVAQIDYQNHC